MSLFDLWLSHLEALGADETIIAENWRSDPYLAEETRDAAGSIADPATPMGVLSDATVKSHQMRPSNAMSASDVTLARVLRLGSFLKRHANADGVFKPDLAGVDVDSLLKNLDPNSQCKEMLGHGECWGLPSNQVPSTEGDELRDSLGLSDYNVRPVASGGEPAEEHKNDLLLVHYPCAGLQCFRPTAVEAGATSAFLPSERDADCGHTQDLATGQRSVPEYVHACVPATNITAWQRRGYITRPPSNVWKTRRLDAIVAARAKSSES